MQALIFLAVWWWRSSAARRAALMLTAAFTVLGAVFVCVSSLTPSAVQQVDKQFGTYQQRVVAALSVGGIPAGTLSQARAALSTAVPGAHVSLQTSSLRPDSQPKAYYEAGIDTVFTIEDPDLQRGFPGRYALDEGRWPDAPGEVAVSRHLRGTLPAGGSFTVLSGRATLRVVGVMTDDYYRHDDIIIAGLGTIEALDPRPPARQVQPVDVQLDVLWRSQHSADDVARTLAPLLPQLPPGQADRAGAIADSHSTRPQAADDPPQSAFGGDRFGVSSLPLVLLALLVAVFVVTATRASQRTDAERLVTLGVRRTTVTTTRVIALSLSGALSIALGLAAGWLLAIALRIAVLDHLAEQPLSPVPGMGTTLAGIAVATVVVVAVGTAWPHPASETPHRAPARWVREIHLPLVRRVLAVMLVLTALSAGGGVYSVLAAYLMLAGVLLLSPDVLALLVRALPRTRARTFVTRAMMTADLRRQGAAVVVIGVCTAVSVCGGTQLASRQASDARYAYATVPPGQVWIEATDDVQDVDGVARVVTAVPGMGDPVVVHSSKFASDPQAKNSTQVSFTKSPTGPGSYSSAIMALGSTDDARRLLGDVLPASAEEVLADGGVIDFNGIPGRQSFVLSTIGGSDVTTAPLPTAHLDLGKSWHGRYAGAVLLSTTERLDLPMNAPQRYYYTDVPLPVAQDAAAAAVKAGYDSGFVRYHTPPPPPQVPTSAWVFLAALALGAFGMLLLVVGGQAAQLRACTARLVAIGLAPRWTGGILALQAGLTVGVGLITGAVAGIAGVQVTASHYTTIVAPTSTIVVSLVATVAAAGAATAVAARRLTATQHPEVT